MIGVRGSNEVRGSDGVRDGARCSGVNGYGGKL